jgi:hypothetical protein
MSDNLFASWANVLTHVIAKTVGAAEDDAINLGRLAETTIRVIESLVED